MEPRKLTTYFDRVANIAVVVAALVLIVLFTRSYLTDSSPQSYPDPLKRGSVLRNIEGVDLHHSVRTLILALSTTCRYCTQDLSFYKQLLSRINTEPGGSIQAIALFPEARDQVDAYLSSHELSVTAVAGVNYGA